MKSLFLNLLLLLSITGFPQTAFTVHFEFDKHELTAAARAKLDSFVNAEKQNITDLTIDLDGYCDISGTEEYNNRLSQKRAMHVKRYLIHKGIEPKSIKNTRPHGRSAPLNQNKTEEERQLNRRVTIQITKGSKFPAVNNDDRSLLEQVADTATKAGTTIVLKNINFYGGSPLPLPESFATMEELFETMRVNYNLVIEIRGHICCVDHPGDSEYRGTGNGLSEERARTVYAHLIGNGIEASRISYKGFGHSQPLYPYPEKTEEERIANRRVEIKIISK